jgi:uncharacterized protein YaiI (UPF0178 family)
MITDAETCLQYKNPVVIVLNWNRISPRVERIELQRAVVVSYKSEWRVAVKVLVDADSCPVRDIVEEVCRENATPVIMVADIAHEITSPYAEVILVDSGPDEADLRIVNLTAKGDLVITGDYGLASLVLSRGGQALHPSGWDFNQENIDSLLLQRHLARKARRAGERFGSNHKARSEQDDACFRSALREILGRSQPEEPGAKHKKD